MENQISGGTYYGANVHLLFYDELAKKELRRQKIGKAKAGIELVSNGRIETVVLATRRGGEYLE